MSNFYGVSHRLKFMGRKLSCVDFDSIAGKIGQFAAIIGYTARGQVGFCSIFYLY